MPKKRVPKDVSDEENKDDSPDVIRPENFTVNKSSDNSVLSSTLIYQNVADAYINDNVAFTTAASTSTARLRSLEQATEDINAMGHNGQMQHQDDSPQKYNYIDMQLMTNQNIDSYNLNSVNQKDQADL